MEEDDARTLEEAKMRELREFELVSMGLEGAAKSHNGNNPKKRKVSAANEAEVDAATESFRQREIDINGKRRKVFELGETGMARYAKEEQERLKKEIERERVEDFHFPRLVINRGTDMVSVLL